MPKLSELESESRTLLGRGGESTLLQELVSRRITRPAAQQLVANYSPERIEKQIAVFDWLVEKRSPLIGRNPAGFLRKAIEENYEAPADYLRDQERKMAIERRMEEEIEKDIERAKMDEIQNRVDEYRAGLSDQERQKLRQEALQLIESNKAIKKEFISEMLIRAKEAEIIRERLDLKS